MFAWFKGWKRTPLQRRKVHIATPLYSFIPRLEALEDRTLLAVTIQALDVASTGTEGQAVSLTAQASSDQPGATLYYTWNFGDSGIASGANLSSVTHTYAAPHNPGTPYFVSLTVGDGTPNYGSASAPITIINVPPTVNAGSNQTLNEGTLDSSMAA